MSDMNYTAPKCGYCGGYHTYSAEMCKDMLLKPGFTSITVPMDYESICAAVLARIREGAVERVANILDEISNASQLAWVGDVSAFAARIVDAVLGGER
jgi:hypothetical protein